jgi:hypothetical protein
MAVVFLEHSYNSGPNKNGAELGAVSDVIDFNLSELFSGFLFFNLCLLIPVRFLVINHN